MDEQKEMTRDITVLYYKYTEEVSRANFRLTTGRRDFYLHEFLICIDILQHRRALPMEFRTLYHSKISRVVSDLRKM
jgi:hypothetical protein